MKIPTLVGIALLIALMALVGMFFYYRSQTQAAIFQISDVEVVNIGNTTATVVWQTISPSTGQVMYSENGASLSEKAIDNRDRRQVRPRLVHFVTLNNLKPNTQYYYKVKNNSELMQQALSFKTANVAVSEEADQYSFIRPLKGTILNTSLNPVDESLIFLKIPGAQKMATFSSTAGNFILPLKTVLSENLSQLFIVPDDSAAELTVVKGSLRSNIKISISESSVNLPPIPIGSNLDLSNFEAQPITNIIFNAASGGLDFNGDGKANSLDLALLKETAKPGNLLGGGGSKFDVNGDGAVDQKDVDEFSRQITDN